MTSDALGLLAALAVASSEVAAPRRPRPALALLASALALLIAALRRSYALIAAILTASAAAFAALLRLSDEVRDGGGWGGIVLGRVAPSVVAGFFHTVGVWVLPFASVWGWSSARDDGAFFTQEVGHLVPATFYYVALVLMPLLLMPRGYERGGIDHQLYESSFNLAFSVVYFVIFRTAHHMYGQDPPELSAPNWDHELLGLVWAGSGAAGALSAMGGQRSSVHVSFPASFMCYSMLTHSNAHHEDMSGAEPWRTTWMKLHRIHGICFGVGAICRLLYRTPEAVFFFFMGSLSFVLSAIWVVTALVDAFDYPEDPESAGGAYPVDHVVSLLVVTAGAVLFPVHVASLGRLREFLERNAATEFDALPTAEDPTDGTDERRALRGGPSNGREDSMEMTDGSKAEDGHGLT